MPCSTCSNTGDLCFYDPNDGRRQRHGQKIVDGLPKHQTVDQTFTEVVRDGHEPLIPHQTKYGMSIGNPADRIKDRHNESGMRGDISAGPDIVPTIQYNREDNTDGSEASHGRLKLQTSRVSETESSQKVADTPVGSHETPTTVLSNKSNDGLGRHLDPKRPAMKDMQGKFGIRSSKWSLNSDEGMIAQPHSVYNFDSVPTHLESRRLARRRLLPKVASTSGARNSNRKHSRPGDQLQPSQFVWRLERRGYAVPGYARTFGNLPFSSSIGANGYPTNVQACQILNFSAPEYLIFPLVETDDSPLARTYVDFQRLGQRLIAEGTPPLQVADQGLIDVTLYFRDRLPEDPVNASTWTAEMLRSFRGTFSDKLLLACAVGVGNLMRWILMPTPENYANIPSNVRPTNLQRLKPHPAWVDLMVFPSFRNALINDLRDWVGPCMKAKWELLWPHSVEEALVHHAYTQRIFLAPEFAAYVVDPKNWLMQRSILDEFPEIEGSEINIVSESET